MSVNTDDFEYKDWKFTSKLWLICFAIMLAPFMEMLDTSIANVSLPHMSGSFSATSDEIIWVITSYLVANGIVIPSTAWFSTIFGRKRFLMGCIVLFTVASALCGFANSLTTMVLARVAQGAGGGALVPISQAILLENFPPSKRGVGMSIFGLGIVVAPIIGPVLGGWITDNYTWRWIFFINIPFGILALILLHYVIDDPDYAQKKIPQNIDYIGFGSLILWLTTLQIILDKGQQANWFEAGWICWLSAFSFLAMVFFIYWELKFSDSIIDLTVFKDINFFLGSVVMFFVSAILYSTLAILPMFLQTLMGYPALDSGLTVMPRGVGAFIGMGLTGLLTDRVDVRILLFIGFALLSFSNYWLGEVNFEIAAYNLLIPNILSGIALSFIFVPLTTVAFTTLKREKINNGTGLFSLVRNVGGSIGTSMVATLLSRNAQRHQVYLVDNLNGNDYRFQEGLKAVTQYYTYNSDPAAAAMMANGFIYKELVRQSSLFSYVDNFRLFGFISLVLIVSIFIFRPNHKPV